MGLLDFNFKNISLYLPERKVPRIAKISTAWSENNPTEGVIYQNQKPSSEN